jgi:hypothetical protein
MIPERWMEIKAKLDTALELEPAQRPAYLDEVAAANPELRHELESLIAAHDQAGTDFLNHNCAPKSLRLLLADASGPIRSSRRSALAAWVMYTALFASMSTRGK